MLADDNKDLSPYDNLEADHAFAMSDPGRYSLMALAVLTALCTILGIYNLGLIGKRYKTHFELERLSNVHQQQKDMADDIDLSTEGANDMSMTQRKPRGFLWMWRHRALFFFYIFSLATLGTS